MSHGSWKDLIKACNEGNESLVACYLKSGVDPNFQHPEYLTTALIETIRAGNLSLVKFLIENGGSDPNLPEELTGMTPIEVSMEEKKFDIIDFFYQRKIGSAEQYVKLILITDASRSGKGTGFAIAKRFLALGHHVVITCPTDTVGEATVKSLIDETGNSKVDYVMGELTSVALVHDLIKQFRKKFAFLDIMVLNSEVWLSEKMINVDGLEMTFMVNYLASYMLCHGLLSCLQHKGAAAEGVRGRSRIIRFSSPIHAFGSARIDKTPRGLDFGCLNTYASVNQCILCFMKYFCSSQAIVAQTKKRNTLCYNQLSSAPFLLDRSWVLWYECPGFTSAMPSKNLG